jgi:anion-transporting  ArsA/GET3 family ATPase
MVSGKGGVGKSTVAAGLGYYLAQKGLKTLVVELGNNSYFDLVYDKKFSFVPTKITQNLDFSIWSGEGCLKEFISHYIRVKAVVDLFFENKIMKTFVRVAPALQELAILGKLTSGPRKIGPPMDYDRIILDGYSSGHFLSLLRVPRAMSETISMGPMGQQSQSIHESLVSSKFCKYIWVTTAEDLPIQETLDFNSKIFEEFNIRPTIVLNKILNLEVPENLSVSPSAFYNYAKTIKQKEREAEGTLGKMINPRVKLPFILNSDPQLRIQCLSSEFSVYESTFN